MARHLHCRPDRRRQQQRRGVAGVNWGARVLPVRVAGKCGATVADLLDGLRWAAGLPVAGVPQNPTPARIISLSFGGDGPCSPAYQETIDAVTQAGALVLVAAGNADAPLTRPANCQRVLTVAAVRRDGSKADYSSFGAGVALAAPGGSNEAADRSSLLLSTSNSGLTRPQPQDNYYRHDMGTSFAAPLAAGVASLMLSVNPALTPSQLVQRLQAGTRPHTVQAHLPVCDRPGVGVCNCTASTCGAGLLDAKLALQQARAPAALIAPLAAAAPGATLTLDGSQSQAIAGYSVQRFEWQQIEGPPAQIAAADQASTTVRLGAVEGVHVFQLSVTDSAGRIGRERVRVEVLAPPVPPPVAGGGGGGASGLLWVLGLWAWVLALAWSMRQRR
ncbi:MAG: hypothetical protein EST26_08130 [Hydrogenophaga sp.]|nr:hypothetical protein [Hydrogenophaga sp.]